MVFCKYLSFPSIDVLTSGDYSDGTARYRMGRFERTPSCGPRCVYHLFVPTAVVTYRGDDARCALDVDPEGSHALIAQGNGCSILVSISQSDGKGDVVQAYSVKEPDLPGAVSYEFGALFARRGMAILYGVIEGCILVWDRASGEIVHGLNHGDGTFRDISFLVTQ